MIYSFEEQKPSLAKSAYIAPGAIIIGRVSVGEESSIWFNTVLRGDINSISVGNKTNIQDGSLVHVTNENAVTIGNRVTIGHGAIIHGCSIKDDCLIAMGAILLDGATIEEEAIVGAGALVPPGMLVPKGSLALGSPARIVRHLTEKDIERIKKGSANYINYGQRFGVALRSID